jgi:hypothetical protein
VQNGATTPEMIEPLSKQLNAGHSSRFTIRLDDSTWTLITNGISRPDIGPALANPRFSTHRDCPARAFSKLIFLREVDHSSREGPRGWLVHPQFGIAVLNHVRQVFEGCDLQIDGELEAESEALVNATSI